MIDGYTNFRMNFKNKSQLIQNTRLQNDRSVAKWKQDCIPNLKILFTFLFARRWVGPTTKWWHLPQSVSLLAPDYCCLRSGPSWSNVVFSLFWFRSLLNLLLYFIAVFWVSLWYFTDEVYVQGLVAFSVKLHSYSFHLHVYDSLATMWQHVSSGMCVQQNFWHVSNTRLVRLRSYEV